MDWGRGTIEKGGTVIYTTLSRTFVYKTISTKKEKVMKDIPRSADDEQKEKDERDDEKPDDEGWESPA